MACRAPGEASIRPDVGQVLMVIHDFRARSSDELSLKKGDRVELMERDDEFGDGWFLGRHLVNGNTGLFPEVYTRLAPSPGLNATPAFTPSQPLTPLVEVTQEPAIVDNANASTPAAQAPLSSRSSAAPSEQGAKTSATLPLSSIKAESTPPSALGNRGSSVPASKQLEDSQVLNETLNVINEHITHLRSAPSTGGLHAPATDSGSEYSMPLDHRMSYIQGEETDEEEDSMHTRAEVEAWSSDDVAEYLFTVGVEKQHCEVFRDQEISGEVLLGMDQSSLFIKAFDLGSVGRRLKTWHKIKTLQDEVSGRGLVSRRTTQTCGSDPGSEDTRRTRSRTSTMTNSVSRPPSVQARRVSMAIASPPTNMPPGSPSSNKNHQDSPTRPTHMKRPSAASIRELHHSRRHSSTDFRMPAAAAANATTNLSVDASGDGVHKKQPSFDRNWTLGGALSQTPPRPLSTDLQDMLGTSGPDLQDSAVDLDRGYFSGTEVDGRKRNILRKQDSIEESMKQSYAEEQRVRSATTLTRQSRYGSVDSFRARTPSPAVQKYFGIQSASHKRTASAATAESVRPKPPVKDGVAPIVTKLDTVTRPARQDASPTVAKSHGFNADWLASVVNRPGSKTPRPGMRAISDKLTFERSKAIITSSDVSPNEPCMPSPARTGSSTPSAGPSFDLDSPSTMKSLSAAATPASKSSRKKGKKETSAYTRGLLKIGPREAMKDADFYGWMKKKSSNLMTTWKPRMFVLKGRRLAYYYSEHDDHEKGLIDISFHRVLPADNEKLTGLHATITGAAGGHSLSASGVATQAVEKGDDAMFIFKLVPPRTGLSKAVNFTKPTVHYFAVQNLKQGRLWMAALMKATIERDDKQPITTTYQQKTISLTKAKQMHHRPPALMNLEEAAEDEQVPGGTKSSKVAGIFGEADSGVSGVDKLAAPKIENVRLDVDFGDKDSSLSPSSA